MLDDMIIDEFAKWTKVGDTTAWVGRGGEGREDGVEEG